MIENHLALSPPGIGHHRSGMALLQRLLLRLRQWHLRRRTIRELSALDDRTLRDIGIHRSEIVRVVDEVLPDARGSRGYRDQPSWLRRVMISM